MSYFAQNGMRIFVDGGLNGPDDPPTIDLGKYFGNLGGASIAPGFVESYLDRQYGEGSGEPTLVFDPDKFTPEQLSAIDEGIDNFYKQRGLGRYSESSVTPIKSEDEGVAQMRRDIEASNRAAEERQLSFSDRLGDAAKGFMSMFNQTEEEQQPVRAIKEPITQKAPADSGRFSTDALISGITAVESSTSATNPMELEQAFDLKSDLKSAAGSSAEGAAQVIPGYFPGMEEYDSQLAFMRDRFDKGAAGERDLRGWSEDNFARYSSEVPRDKFNRVGQLLGHEITPDDFAFMAHFGGIGRTRQMFADLRDGKITAEEFVNTKPTEGNLTYGDYLSRAYEAASKFQNPEMKSEGGMMAPDVEGDPVDPKKMAMYSDAFKKTMGDNYQNVPPEMMANITDLVSGGDLLSKVPEINAQLAELRKLGLNSDVLFDNLAEAEGGGFGSRMKFGTAKRIFKQDSE